MKTSPAGLAWPAICWILWQPVATQAAENLHMRAGISFFHDLDQGFPIMGDKMDDAQVATGKPTLVFFGAAGDLNTNRQARRIVDLYKKYNADAVKFIVVDVDNATTQPARLLIKTYYPGYIPTQVLFDKQGKAKWNHTGEVDASVIGGHLDKLL
jgi:hypothetical protein